MPWPRRQAVAILLDAQRRGKRKLAAKAKDSLRKPKPKKQEVARG